LAAPAAELQPTVAVVLGSRSPQLAYEVKNVGDSEIRVSDAGTSRSPIIITTPDGVELTKASNVDYTDGPPRVAPGQSYRMKLNLDVLFSLLRLTEKGTYQLKWQVHPQGMEKMYTSNVLLVEVS
jgi:hypothetical protein